MPISWVVPQLIDLRDELTEETQRYAQRENPNQPYLDRRNRQISRLWENTEALQRINEWDLWARCEGNLQALRDQDTSINSVLIELTWGPNPSRQARMGFTLTNQP